MIIGVGSNIQTLKQTLASVFCFLIKGATEIQLPVFFFPSVTLVKPCNHLLVLSPTPSTSVLRGSEELSGMQAETKRSEL